MQLSSDPLALGSIGVLPPSMPLDWLNYINMVSKHGHNTFFASAELSNVSTGLMNGAVEAGEAAADLIATVLNSTEVFRDSSRSTFAYSTSTHYPPTDDVSIYINIV